MDKAGEAVSSEAAFLFYLGILVLTISVQIAIFKSEDNAYAYKGS
jgi:hypothetical protein